MNRHMDWLPKTNCHGTFYKVLDIPNLAESSVSVTSLGNKDRPMRVLVFVYIVE